MRAGQLNDTPAPGRFVLVHRHTGRATGRPTVVLLHDRYDDLTALDAIARELEPDHAVLAIRGARTQIRDQFVHGYYWFIEHEPCHPEASTLGDALAQLELGLLEHEAQAGDAGFALVGRGQGATVALLLATGWPELVRAVVAIDGCLPPLPAGLAPDPERADGLRVLLIDTQAEVSDATVQAREALERRGALVDTRHLVGADGGSGDAGGVTAVAAAWLRG